MLKVYANLLLLKALFLKLKMHHKPFGGRALPESAGGEFTTDLLAGPRMRGPERKGEPTDCVTRVMLSGLLYIYTYIYIYIQVC